MPQRFLYSIGAAGAAVGAAVGADRGARRRRRCWRCWARASTRSSVRRGPAVSDDSDGWYRLARGVMRRPSSSRSRCTALLLAASSPLLSTVLTGPSAEAVPPGQPSYAVNEYIEEHYSRGVAEASP